MGGSHSPWKGLLSIGGTIQEGGGSHNRAIPPCCVNGPASINSYPPVKHELRSHLETGYEDCFQNFWCVISMLGLFLGCSYDCHIQC